MRRAARLLPLLPLLAAPLALQAGEAPPREAVVVSRLGLELSGAAKVEGGVLLADDELVGAVTLVADPAKPRSELVKLYRDTDDGSRLLPIEDVEDLAVSADDGDRVYLLGSHNPSKKGRRRKEREFLIRAKWAPADKKLKVKKARHVVDLYERIPKELRKGLNLEGLAVHDGTLYLGLRAPLDASKRAVLLHTRAKRLFGKQAKRGELQRIALDLKGQGIRGLCWDGEVLLVSSGPPVDDPTADSHLWCYAPKRKTLTQLASFPPARGVLEAVCRLNAKELLLGFDDDGKTGLLVRWPWTGPTK